MTTEQPTPAGETGPKVRQKRRQISSREVLTAIVFSIEHPVSSLDLRERFKISRAVLSYHAIKLRNADFIKTVFSNGCDFFEPTEKGRYAVVKTSTVGVMPPLAGLHNIAFAFPLLSGKQPHFKKIVHMRGWDKYQTHFDGYLVESTPQNILVHPIKKEDRMFGDDPDKMITRARDTAMRIAQKLADKLDLRLGEPVQFKEAEFGLEDPIAKAMKCDVNTKEFKRDDSLKNGGEFDVRNPQTAKDYFKVIKGLAPMIDRLDAAMEKMTELVALQTEQQTQLRTDLNYIAQNYRSHVGMVEKGDKIFARLLNVLDKLDLRLSQRRLGGRIE